MNVRDPKNDITIMSRINGGIQDFNLIDFLKLTNERVGLLFSAVRVDFARSLGLFKSTVVTMPKDINAIEKIITRLKFPISSSNIPIGGIIAVPKLCEVVNIDKPSP